MPSTSGSRGWRRRTRGHPWRRLGVRPPWGRRRSRRAASGAISLISLSRRCRPGAAVGALVFTPLDVLRVRLQLKPDRYPTYNVAAGLRAIACIECVLTGFARLAHGARKSSPWPTTCGLA